MAEFIDIAFVDDYVDSNGETPLEIYDDHGRPVASVGRWVDDSRGYKGKMLRINYKEIGDL